MKFRRVLAESGNKSEILLFQIDTNREKTMSKTKITLATLALGAAVAFAGSAFAADKMKATLDGKSEVPPNTSAGKGTAAFPWSGRSRRQRGRRRCDPQCDHEPG
jgi:hypothetical protein